MMPRALFMHRLPPSQEQDPGEPNTHWVSSQGQARGGGGAGRHPRQPVPCPPQAPASGVYRLPPSAPLPAINHILAFLANAVSLPSTAFSHLHEDHFASYSKPQQVGYTGYLLPPPCLRPTKLLAFLAYAVIPPSTASSHPHGDHFAS